MIKLGINIDHVATLRQARGTKYPSVDEAALRAEQAGADSITLHLRHPHNYRYEFQPQVRPFFWLNQCLLNRVQ